MKTPDVWNDTLNDGYVTTDMIDSAAMAAEARAWQWKANAAACRERLKERPNSATLTDRLDLCIDKVAFYNQQKKALLATCDPKAVVRYVVDGEEKCYYAFYVLKTHRYLVPLLKDEATKMATKHGIGIVDKKRLRNPSTPAANCASWPLVNRILATIHDNGITKAVPNGIAQHDDPNWVPSVPARKNPDRKHWNELRDLYDNDDDAYSAKA